VIKGFYITLTKHNAIPLGIKDIHSMEQPNGLKKIAYLKSPHGSQENFRRWLASATFTFGSCPMAIGFIRENIS
jgi:hypothetical protein